MAENVYEITDVNFDTEVVKSTVPVLVDFWAEWCGPCKMLGPTIEKLARETDLLGKCKIGKLNVDNSPNVSTKYGIQAIPTLIIFKGGAEHTRLVGVKSEKDIRAALEKAIV